MLVKDRMTVNPLTITKQTTIAAALQLMRDKKVRRLPVMEGEKLIGIVTDRDLSEVSPSPATSLSMFELNYLLAKSTIGDSAMKKQKLLTISPDAFIEEAALIMRDNKVGGLPVLDNGKLVGIITETNIFDAFIDIMGLRQKGYRITVLVKEDRYGVMADLTKVIAANEGNITHTTTYHNQQNDVVVIFRLDSGDIIKIIEAIRDLGYPAEYIETNRA